MAAWALWALVLAAVVATYSRVPPEETYNVSREGVVGGLSRGITVLNFPFALVAIGLALVAVAALPRAAWLAAGPAIALCATIPLFNEQADLDAKWGNAIPALGVAIVAGLTVVATRRAGAAFAPRQPWDGGRLVLAAVVFLVSLPWITAELGFHFPGDLFMGEELGRERDGTLIAAVHLGHHHGGDGAMLVLTALLLSRVVVVPGVLRTVVHAYVGLMFAYGAVNFVQDAWNEQLVKRGWTDASIPSALLPGLKPIWAVVLVLAAVAGLAFRREDERTSYSAP